MKSKHICKRRSKVTDQSIHSQPNRGLPLRDSGTPNPSYRHSPNRYPPKKNLVYQIKDKSAKVARVCVYCNGEDHRSAECGKFPYISQNRRIIRLQEDYKRLCFNCTGTRHEWLKFVRSLSNKVEVSRSLARFREPVEGVVLHAFGDTSASGISAAVYAVITQASGVSKGLIAAKSKLAKRNLTILRLELVAAHMAANLVDNVRTAFERYPITSVHGRSDSTIALHWIKGGGSYKQFVTNRVRKISSKDFIEWRHVDTNHNPADIRSRGCNADQLTGMWLSGPKWLHNPEKWPRDVVTKPNKEAEAKAKRTREVSAIAVDMRDDCDEVLEKQTFWRVIRISA